MESNSYQNLNQQPPISEDDKNESKLSHMEKELPLLTYDEIAELKEEKVRRKNRLDKLPKGGWEKVISKKVLEIFPEKDVYTVAAGISPSGSVHAGNFRDVITAEAARRSLENNGKKTRFVFSWDDYDRLRKVPKNIDPRFEKYIGMPLSQIPDPFNFDPQSKDFGKPVSEISDYEKDHKTWAQVFEEEFEESMERLGIEMEYRYQSNEYQDGTYDDKIIFALKNRRNISKIFLSQMSKKSIIEKINKQKGFTGDQVESEIVLMEEIAEWGENYVENFFPISVYSEFSGKDNTEVLNFDGDHSITYKCLETGRISTIDITEIHVTKLNWKVDWAMRWLHEDVVFEPGGADHGSPNSSYDTSSIVARSIFNIEPPVFAQYQFIGFAGQGKMSSSSGDVITPGKLLEIYSPDILKWIYLKTEPSSEFDIALGGDQIIRTYMEFDREKENSDQIPFKQAVEIGQLTGWDTDATTLILEKLDLGESFSKKSIEERLAYARAALETYDQDSIIELLPEKNEEYFNSLNPSERMQLQKLKSSLESFDFEKGNVSELESLLYGIPKEDLPSDIAALAKLNPRDPDNFDIAEKIKSARREASPLQRNFFKNIYMLLLNREKGPRLPTFAWVMRDKFIELLDF